MGVQTPPAPDPQWLRPCTGVEQFVVIRSSCDVTGHLPTLSTTKQTQLIVNGIANYAALGHVPPRLTTIYFFSSL